MNKLLITRKEAAEALSISVDTLDEFGAAGKLKAVLIGVRVYFSPAELEAFVRRRDR